MKRAFPYILGLLIILAVGAFLQHKFCCDNTPAKKGFYVEISDGSAIVDVADNFNYELSGQEHIKPISEDLQVGIATLKDYLAQHPEKALVITGLYDDIEKEGLGPARAKDIGMYLNSQGISPLQLKTEGALDESLKLNELNIFIGSAKYKIGEAVKVDFGKIRIEDDGLSFSSDENFNFKKDDYHYQKPVAESIINGIAQLAPFLSENKDKVFEIVGYYRADEKNNSIYSNLGLARANNVKNYLVSRGVPSNQLSTRGELTEYLDKYTSLYYGPVGYNILTVNDEKRTEMIGKFADFAKDIKANPLVLYFENGEVSIQLTKEQRTKISMLSKYIDYVDDAKALIVGHTSNIGDWKMNYKLGQERADFLKEYLMSNGISGDNIITNSKGESQPIATNATEEDRAKNRRVVLTLK